MPLLKLCLSLLQQQHALRFLLLSFTEKMVNEGERPRVIAWHTTVKTDTARRSSVGRKRAGDKNILFELASELLNFAQQPHNRHLCFSFATTNISRRMTFWVSCASALSTLASIERNVNFSCEAYLSSISVAHSRPSRLRASRSPPHQRVPSPAAGPAPHGVVPQQ
ncbi:hypothetical protein TraAM80_07444 [Trypanosoma rangeli]|uniref:Uncharacterized protein n=1 Tax=Trypanosoma rangeli TaxID=5698 RepID=A0A422N5H1_TRYRA|nr:uncharacterized protein TraAM80_07444 [Trypanosoma rangeli]RNF00719.1 hypothetical protein TraAM80_07444 [Trypanosoma rangeli]|eukprot:RNF00719.1 hypothetical protein TraAM80_07444 [Trypanosoma rangeli]